MRGERAAAYSPRISAIEPARLQSQYSQNITLTLAHSPAEEAGLLKGDAVLTIDGKPPFTLGLMEIYRMFKQEGREFRLEVRRKNKQSLEIKLKTRRLI